MQDQPKFYPQRGTTAFADGRSVRPQVPGTIARSQGMENDYLHTGLTNGVEGDGIPFPLTMELVERGQERYNIYCSPCHSRTGYGHGTVVQRGYQAASSLHTSRLRDVPLGHFFNVITHGYGAMPNYAAEVAVEDRWAIAAYIRALQLSQNAEANDVPSGEAPAPLSKIASDHGFNPSAADLSFWHSGETHASQPASPGHTTVLPIPANAVKPSPSAPPAKIAETEVPQAPKTHAGNATSGDAIYQKNCAMCHQADLTGRPPMFPPLVGVLQRKGEEHVRSVITNGAPDARPMMPAFADRISASDVDDLIAYMKSIKP